MRTQWLRQSVLACLLILALVAPCIAGDQVPFKGNLALQNQIPATNEGCPLGTLRNDSTGGGYLTHMGAVLLNEVVCLNPNNLTFTASFALTAANGDTVNGVVTSGQAFPTSDPNVISVLGHWTITGGTGRFAGATGTGIGTGTVNFATGQAPHRLEGTISTVGSNRR